MLPVLLLLAAAVAAAAAPPPARAELTADQKIRVLEGKARAQRIMRDAVAVLDSSSDPEARRTAQAALDWLQWWFTLSELFADRW